jgi:hypothetical protein
LNTAKDFFLEQTTYQVPPAVPVAGVDWLSSLEEATATATATTATAAATMPAVIPPAAAPVAPVAPPGAGACAKALPATNTDAIKIASAFFIFLSCIDLGKKPSA